jgi:tetratricopeptide (TPR) repeat protein
VAESLKELSGERVEEYAGRIGEHYERAGEWAHAAEWYGRAGQQAQSTYAPEAAIGYYHKALAFWKESGGSSDARSDWLADIHDGLGAMLIIQARHAEALETYTTMRAQAEAAGDLRAQSRAWYGLAQAQVYQGDTRAALESAEKAGAVAEAASAKLERVKALWTKSWISYLLGEVETARTLGERLLVMASDLDDQGQMVSRVLNVLGAVHNMLGQYDQAQQRWENALQVCQERGDRQQVMNLLNNLGVIAEARGDYGAAFTRYEEALRIAHAIGDRDGELTFLSNVGAARVGRGDFRAAETDLREVIRMAGTSGSGVLPNTYYFLAEACLGQGQAEAALDAARQALALGQAGEIPEYIAAAWRALGMVAAHLPEPIAINDKETGQPKLHDTTACLTESLRICTEMGMEGERARTLRAWAEYELKRGDRARGAAMWQEAREIFARLGADLEAARMGDAPSAD